ncbi:hypothetical protein [Pectinatus frisingensis]|uniref:hypothetical protein n=1 Tax=Pectinatus frisingensis TaxID=865 RepID=UPI0018C7E464|nr:hypothetical protein [Pectinatus frisingensis]
MKKASVLVFILCTLCSQVAFAASWYWIGQDTSGDQWYIDNASVQKDYYNAIVWIKINKADGESTVEQMKLDHVYKTYAILAFTNYDSDGNVTDSGTNNYPSYDPIVPDSMGDAIYHNVWSN